METEGLPRTRDFLCSIQDSAKGGVVGHLGLCDLQSSPFNLCSFELKPSQ